MDDPATAGIFETGFDPGTGHGLVQADAAFDLVPPLVEIRPVAAQPRLIRADVTFGAPPPPLPFEAEPAQPRFNCRSAARCQVPVTCNRAQVAGNQCANPIEIFVPRRALRTAGEALTKGPRLIPFGASVTNVPPGAIGNVRLKLEPNIRKLIRKTKKKSIRAQMQIRSAAGSAIETRRIKIRLK